MNLHTLKPAKGAVKKEKRIGRGQGSGHGGTSTRGHKGAQSRSGYSRKIGFEGGQMPLQRRIPKKGFKNFTRVEFRVLNLAQLQALADKHGITVFDFDILHKLRVVQKEDKLKILGNGQLTVSLQVTAHAFSEKAKAAIEAQGGTATNI